MTKIVTKPKTFRGSITDLHELGSVDSQNKTSSIEILKVGSWDHPVYGEIDITFDRLERFRDNFENKVRKAVAIDIEHKSDEGAVGWVKRLFISDEGVSLMAEVEWTDEGVQLLGKKKYRFFSPEFNDEYENPATGAVYKDVLIGGAITNRPFFQELSEIVLSEKFAMGGEKKMEKKKCAICEKMVSPDKMKDHMAKHKTDDDQKKKGGEPMTKEELKKKLSENISFVPSEQDKVDMKTFAEAYKEVTAESKKNELIKGNEPTKGTVTLSEDQLNKLETAANDGVKAMREIRKMKIEKEINSFKFSSKNSDGVITKMSAEIAKKLVFTLGPKQRLLFSEFLKSLPKVKIFTELGSDYSEKDPAKTPAGVNKYSWQLTQRAKKMSEENPDKYKNQTDALFDAEEALKKEGIIAE